MTMPGTAVGSVDVESDFAVVVRQDSRPPSAKPSPFPDVETLAYVRTRDVKLVNEGESGHKDQLPEFPFGVNCHKEFLGGLGR